ncbi:amidohydrolase family protein [Virgibacillus pantothenticus]|uniref:amidohydrolase family protein n=1 Tax=Virgibacillus pantothenticus TaxID=1473 RepID=UPI0020B332ED|nr:amidohydrolase family protein [Virgibacillus pantothenticus]MEB5450844.1 amidohydrolase family protein [Virgibacillus pantothenticus]MEB5454865.1 amidohydrolase family protein [Virgibacillus pantothenticus]MEB5458787.1 amidohydrolase family protein [Virgibacillus pantothenticus]MEB5463542.1 amidohydrolase family protein [Virgibacillus pantothenticus]MEB5468078.1 amidohydrolase family protein [Virgibacillus pantothenticus]
MKNHIHVDFHTHIISEEFLDLANKYGDPRWPVIQKTCSCGANIMINGSKFREVTSQAWDIKQRLQDMDREGIDIQVLSPIPVTLSYWSDPEKGLEMAKFQNNFIASIVKEYPNRFLGLGTVPLQDVHLAINEMERSMNQLGLSGLQIGTNINGKNLDDLSLKPFFRYANDWKVPLFVHPWATLGKERMQQHHFMYTLGMPSETSLAAGSIIMSGMLDQFNDLKLCFAHGGGSLPYLLPRLDKGWNVWPQIRKTEQPPSEYAKLLYYDSLVYDETNLQLMINRIGIDQIIVGTDYPFLLRESPAGDVINKLIKLNDQERMKLKGKNALRFLNFDV